VGAGVDLAHQSRLIRPCDEAGLDSLPVRGHHPRTMSDDKPKPVDDIKQGLNLLFRAAKGAVDKIPTDKIEGAMRDGAKEVGKAFETVATEIDKVVTNVTTGRPASTPPAHQPPAATAEGEKKDEAPPAHYDDAYAPEPPAPGKGPRIG
jgi:hypothetical protein